MRDSTARHLSRLHIALYRATGGRAGRRLVNNDILLLTTTGRRTGRKHTTPLLYLRDGSAFIVIASWGGRDYAPDWYRNITSDPAVVVRLPGRRFRARAAVLPEPERSTWWGRAVAAYDGYAAYQTRTERVIPILRLTPQN